MSHLARFDLWSARYSAWEFGKTVAYFVLLVSVINTPRRFTSFLTFLVVCIVAVNVLSVCQYHGFIDIPALSVLVDSDYDELTGELRTIPRMRSTGIFNDPNDLSMIIVAGMMLCAAGLFYKKFGIGRVALAVPFGFLFYCLTLTQSRGGLLAFLAGCGVLTYLKLGPVRSGLAAIAGCPILLMGLGGRQADIGGAMSGGTGHARVELWSQGLQLFKSSPLFGIGQNRFSEEVGLVAHNSFVHAFTELGLLGGMLFLGVIAVSGWSLWSLRNLRKEIDHPGLGSLHPFLLALMVAYAISLMSVSRNYVVPTYLVAGLAASYDTLVRPGTSLTPLRFNAQLVTWLMAGSVVFIAILYFYVKFHFSVGE
jgi:hypothetical protein